MATKTTATAAPDPKSLMGNPARTAPAAGQSSAVPLDLDAVFASPIPTAIPYPYAQSPHLTDPAKILVNDQAYLDYVGVVTPFVDFMNSNKGQKPNPTELQHIATTSGVIFTYDGKTYKPGAYAAG